MRLQEVKTWIVSLSRGLVLVVLLTLCIGACASTSITKVVDTRDILEVATLVSDQELDTIRGAYVSYYFGMDVAIDLTSAIPQVTMTYTAVVPEGAAPSFEGNSVHFNDGNVAFDAGVGDSALGKGVYSVVNVAGNDNIVIANTNVNINIPNASRLIPMVNALQTPLSLSGIK